jgi:eukaryotic-like serine/threonine-protein kinase
VHDLEQALAIEVARSGESGGEATSVLRALPGETAEFAPLRLRNPRRWLVTVGAILLLAGGAVAYFATRTERGAGPAATPRGGDLTRVALNGDAAMDYDPQGDEQESSDATRNAIDGNRTTIWDTESYESDFQSLGKDGVGLYVDAGSPVAARRLTLTTSTPGFSASVYAADRVPEDIDGWRKVSADTTVEETARIKVDTLDQSFRYYLLWITDLGESEKAEIQELTLFR